MRRWLFDLLVLIVITGICCSIVSAGGIALAPSKLEVSDAVRGGEYERSISVINPMDLTSFVTLGSEGDAGEWITYYTPEDPDEPILEVTVPGMDRVYLIARIIVPADAANGIYTAKLFADTKPEAGSGGTVGAIFRAVTTLSVSVTDKEILSGMVERITVPDTEVNAPLTISVQFRNTGNVIEKPEISTAIFKGGSSVARFIYGDTGVKPGTSDTIRIDWDTTGLESGDYSAKVSVSLAGKMIGEEEAPFKILPVGSLTRNGMLSDLSCEGDTTPGSVLKIMGTFYNIGQIKTKAKLVGEVYRDGTLVDTFESDELSVPVNGKEDLACYVDVADPGVYTISAYVLYEGMKTDMKDLQVNVAEPSQATPVSVVPAIGALLAAGFFVYLTGKRRK